MGERKHLRVRYLFRGQLHETVIEDVAPFAAPLRCELCPFLLDAHSMLSSIRTDDCPCDQHTNYESDSVVNCNIIQTPFLTRHSTSTTAARFNFVCTVHGNRTKPCSLCRVI